MVKVQRQNSNWKTVRQTTKKWHVGAFVTSVVPPRNRARSRKRFEMLMVSENNDPGGCLCHYQYPGSKIPARPNCTWHWLLRITWHCRGDYSTWLQWGLWPIHPCIRSSIYPELYWLNLNSMDAILACHPALSTEWLDRVAVLCALMMEYVCTGSSDFSRIIAIGTEVCSNLPGIWVAKVLISDHLVDLFPWWFELQF